MKKLLTLSFVAVGLLFASHSFALTSNTSVNAEVIAPISVTTVGSLPAVNLAYSSTLRPGVNSAEVIALQTRLKNLGYYTLNIDGKYGPGTKSAVTQFQTAHNLSADGIAGANTFTSLSVASTGSIMTLPPVVVDDNSDVVACNMMYKPVCGQPHQINCIQAPCPQPEPTTYANLCMLNGANATLLYEGECKPTKYNDVIPSAASAGVVVYPSSIGAVPTLRANATLRQGSSNTAVSTLQASLKNLGYYSATVDGKYGPATVAAVRNYQQVKSLKVDGIVGVKTLSTIATDSALSAKSNTNTSSTSAVMIR